MDISWDITMRCNYSCAYCESYDNTQPTNFKTINEYETALRYLVEHFNTEKLKIEILGGEPTLYKQWTEILNAINTLGARATIFTNLSMPTKTLKKRIEQLTPKKCINVSWHTEFADHETMVENIRVIHESGHLNCIDILADKRSWTQVVKAYDAVQHTKVASLMCIKDEAAGEKQIIKSLIEYTDEEMQYINATHQTRTNSGITTIKLTDQSTLQLNGLGDFYKHNMTNFKGMQCEIGQQRIHIKPNGDVFPSACMLNYEKACMGNLYKQTIRKPRRPVTCPFDMCACGPDLRITKYRGNRYD